MAGTIAQEGLRPPSLAIFEASPRLAGRTCLSLSFSGEGGSSSGVPSGQESSVLSRAVPSKWALGPTGPGKVSGGHRSLGWGCGRARESGRTRVIEL